MRSLLFLIHSMHEKSSTIKDISNPLLTNSHLLNEGQEKIFKNYSGRSIYLPPEILHEIFSFFAKSIKDILIFRTISSMHRSIAEHSLIWFSIPMIFCAPEKLQSILSRGGSEIIKTTTDLSDRELVYNSVQYEAGYTDYASEIGVLIDLYRVEMFLPGKPNS